MSVQVDSQGPSSEATKLEIPKTEPGAQHDLLNLYCSSLYRKCSNCGRTGHNSRTCLEARTEPIQSSEPGPKSKSEGGLGDNLKDDGDDVEVSEDGGSDQKIKLKEGSRKKGVAWTEEEHKQFLNGLQKLGKGNWRGISRHFVQSKSPTQVASHAQKYFIRQTVAGKRKRRSSLFDLVPENEPQTRETDVTSQTTTFPANTNPGKQEPQSERPNPAETNIPPSSLQGPEALAWAYWYQSMLMQSNPMTWLPSMMGSVPPPNSGIKSGDFPQNQGSFAGIPNSVPGITSNPLFPSENSGDANNPAFAAYLAQQSQMAAMLAMNCMPQFPPDYLARYAAGLQIHAQAAQAAQKTQSAISSKRDLDKLETEGSADDNLSTLDATHINSLDIEEPMLKFPRRSENGSRFEVSNASSDTEDFGNGALVRPKASKAKSWVELPSFLQERKDAGSLLNTGSKQSQSTKIGALWLSKQHNLVDGQTHSSQGTPPTNSASNLVDISTSDTPSATMDPNLATSHYKEKSVIAQNTPSQAT